jgi:two-component system, OmpR family, phosphate regulon response regulator OmpR
VISREDLVDQLGRDGGERRPGAGARGRRADHPPAPKIEPDPKRPRYLQTVRGAGYMLTAG